jgi:hypothetical protein
MKSEQLKEEIRTLEEQRSKLSLLIAAKNDAYLRAINDESEFNEGDKVALFRNGRKIGEGVFSAFFLQHGHTKPFVFKVKADGTKSKNSWPPYDFDQMEKAEK